jgi:anti-sigma-K factor RskA
MAALLADVPEVAAPSTVRAAVMTRLFPAPATQSGRGWLRWFWPGLLAGTALAGLLLVLALPVLGPRAPAYQATLGADGAAVRMVAAYDDRSGDLVLSGIVGRPAAGRDFELWLIPMGQPPVSLGVLPATTTASVAVPAALRVALAAGALAVSDEPAGGSPTGLPTGAVLATALLRGPVTGS